MCRHELHLWGNTSSCGATATQIDSDKDPVPIVHYSCVQGGWTATSEKRTSTPTPCSSMATGPTIAPARWTIIRGWWGYSPAISAGDGAVPEETLDLDRNPRHFDAAATADTGKGMAPFIDMGAFEYQGDCNGNGRPDARTFRSAQARTPTRTGFPTSALRRPSGTLTATRTA